MIVKTHRSEQKFVFYYWVLELIARAKEHGAVCRGLTLDIGHEGLDPTIASLTN